MRNSKPRRSAFAAAALTAAAVLSLVAGGCDSGDHMFVFRWAGAQPSQHPRSQSMVFFEQELERRTGGRIQVENYFSGVLGRERDVMDMVATGVLQGTRGGLYADASVKYRLFELPFLFANWDEVLRFAYSDFTKQINQGARVNGYHIPACGISQGFRVHTNAVRPIRKPEDLRRLKMRVPPQEVFLIAAQAFGANPQEIPFAEVYQAIRTGVIDGQDNAASNVWDYKIHEVQKYLSVTGYATGADPFIVSLDWYQRLPRDLQLTFDEVAREAISYSDRLNRESAQKYLDLLSQELETNYLTLEGLERFRELSQVVYRHFVDKGDISWHEIEEVRRIAKGN